MNRRSPASSGHSALPARIAVALAACVLATTLGATSASSAPPGPPDTVTMRSDVPAIDWTPVAEALTYDVVFGDLGLLQSSGGDYTTATLGCVANSTRSTSVSLAVGPAPGQGLWFLVRGNNGDGAGSYDSGDPSQVGSRDAEIEASPLSCHLGGSCGDGACDGSEDSATCPADCGPSQCTTDAECQPASCCNPTSCITIWEPQSCGGGTCSDGCFICLSACVCQAGACAAIF